MSIFGDKVSSKSLSDLITGGSTSQPASDPYAGLGTVDSNQGHQSDPYAGLGTIAQNQGAGAAHDPYEGLGTVEQPHQAPQAKSSWGNIGRGLAGAYQESVTNGLLAEPVRWGMEHTDFGGYNEKIRAKFPGQTDQWYQDKVHDLYNQAIVGARQNATEQVTNNPYPGHQIGNTVAAIAGSADPTWLVAPGAGLEKGVFDNGVKAAIPKIAQHVGASAGRMAVVGSAADTAAQLMDMGEGVQKNFDIERNLKSAAMTGAFGGAHAAGAAVLGHPGVQGAIDSAPIPDFVKGLFVNRGVDTTPGADPSLKTSPLTGDSWHLKPEDQAQYQHVLNTGSVDDIKGFFQGRNGPQPSYQDVNKWVEYRDSVPEGFAQDEFKPQIDEHEVHRSNVEQHIDAQTEGWKNKPDVEVINHVNDIQDPEVRQKAIDDGVTHENTVGFVGGDGKVRVFANQVKTPDKVNAVLYHEALGHYGLAQKFGAGLDRVLQTLVDKNVGQFGKKVDEWQKANPGAYGGDRIRAAEEVLAEQSQNGGPLKKSWGDAIVSHVRRFGRSMGLNLSYSDAEVQHILAMAHDAVINGKGRDVRANGFKSSDKWLNFEDNNSDSGNRMMYAGENAEAKPGKPGLFSKGEWFKGADGKQRFEISDHGAELKNWDNLPAGKSFDYKGENAQYKLEDVLDHPPLYKAYPELRDITVTKAPAFMDMWGSTQGWFNPKSGVLNVAPKAMDPKSTMLHEIQHWIQSKEKWSFGGNEDTVRLDNKSALGKLQKFYERKLSEAKQGEKPDGSNWTQADARSQSSEAWSKLNRTKELQADSHELPAAYAKADELGAKHKAALDEVTRVTDHFDAAYQKELQAYEDRKSSLNVEIDKLKAEQDKAYKDQNWDRHAKLHDKLMALLKYDNPYPHKDWAARDAAVKEAKAHAENIHEQLNEATKNIDGIKGKYSDLSFDLYKLIAGEREARDTQARQHLRPDERKKIAPYTHEGILNDEVIHTTGDGQASDSRSMSSGEQLGQEADEQMRNYRWGETPHERLTRAQRTLAAFGGDHPEARAVADHASDEMGLPRVEDARRQMDKPELMGDSFFDNRAVGEGPGPAGPVNEQAAKIRAIRENSPNRFMTPKQLNASIADGTYQVQQMEEAYKATDRDYVPTVRPWSEVRQEALNAGFSPSQIKAMGHGPDITKRLFRIQAAAKVLDSRISGLLEKFDTPEWSVGHQNELRQALVDHAYVLSKLRDERAETARALNMSKAGYTRGQMESYGEILREGGGTMSPLGDDDTLNRFARTLKSLVGGHNPAGLNSAVSALSKPNWEDYLTTLHQNMMLSGMSTHVKAPLDMMIGIGRDLLDNAYALPLSAGREALRSMGVNVKPGVHPTEVAARLWGILRAALDADTYKNTASTFVNGGVNPNGFGGKSNARIPVLSKVTDLISAQDQFFRAFSTNMHLYGLGTRQALDEARANGTPKDWDTIMTQGSSYARMPNPKLLAEARALADRDLLLNKNAITAPLDKMKRTTPDSSVLARMGAFIANFLTPFVRVESNSLMSRVIRRSPLAIFDPQTIKDFKAGGPAADVAAMRIIMGTASIVSYWMAAGQGKTTGEGPDNPAKRAVMEATGWRPKSVHENGQYNTGNKLGVSLNPFDVHNSTASMVAGLREAYEKGANEGQVGTGIKLALLSTFKSLADMSYINDIAPAVNAITAPNATMEQKTGQFLGDQASTMMPNLFGQASRVADQNQRMTNVPGSIGQTVVNSMKQNVPGLRETLPERMDPFGEPFQSGASMFGEHTWLPQGGRITAGNHVDETRDPAKQEIGRLTQLYKENIITPVQRTISIDGEKKKLTNEQLSEYQRMAGREIIESLRDQINTPEWHQMSDDDKAQWIMEMQRDKKAAVRDYLYGS